MSPVLASLRPLHWLKNLPVLAPLLFAGRLTDPASLQPALLACLAFCLLASGVYLFNDLHDRQDDRRHPGKARRPIAAGLLGPGAVTTLALLLLAAGLGLAAVVHAQVLRWCALYVALNAAYTLAGRGLPLADVALLAAGFLLRALAGAAALQLQPSRWLLLCCAMLGLCLASGKRLLELVSVGSAARPALAAWPPRLLSATFVSTAVLTVLAYAVYTVAPDTRARLGSAALAVTAPPVAVGVLRFVLLVRRGVDGDLMRLLAGDKLFLAAGTAWCLLALLVIYAP